GVLVGLSRGDGGWSVWAAAAVAVVGTAVLWRRRPALAILAVAWGSGAGLGAWSQRPETIPAVLAHAFSEKGPAVEVEGVWLRTMKLGRVDAGGRGLVATHTVAGVPFEKCLALTLIPGQEAPRAGDRIRFQARVGRARGLANPGLSDAGLLARAQGIELTGALTRSSRFVILAEGSAWGVRRFAEQAHVAMSAAIDRGVKPAHAPLVKALVLGERSAAGPEVEAGFKAAGAVHALSVSGLHLTALAAAVFFVLRRVLLAIPRLALRLRVDSIAAVISIPVVLFYCAITGEATATRRAALMAALALGAVLCGRMPSLPSAIGASALALLVESPLLVIDPSFQLSFASVIALALVSGRWRPLGEFAWWGRAAIWCARSGAVSTAAFVATSPLVAHHFAELAPLSPLGNLVLVPPVELGIVPLGLLGAALGTRWSALAQLPLTIVDRLCALVLWLAARFREWAPLLPVASPDGFEATAMFLAAVLGLAALRGGILRKTAVVTAALLAFAGSVHLAWRSYAIRHREDVAVTFLDVGQGDAALIEGPAGFFALIDGGGVMEGTFDPGARVIEPVLRRKTIGHLDLVVLSHPHPDHMNGLFRVFERFSIGTLWTSGDGRGEPAYERLLALARARGVLVETPKPFTKNGLSLTTLAPFVGDRIAPPPGLGANDASLVVRLDFAGRRVLFTGDIEEQGEAELVGRHGQDLRADVLKVPHHASRTSSGADLLAAAAPGLAVASLGWRNRFGFPHPEVVGRYVARGISLDRTDRSGALTVQITREGILRTTCVRSCR
ncbi:MAG TPA: DNA internalization-related competence protein ComEC/Rec2, partial [Polyangia bacterium]